MIYREFDFTLGLDEINERLTAQGFSPVKPRTFRHYGKLQRLGYERYVPINQLDVKTLRDPFFDEANRSRLHPVQTSTAVMLEVLEGGVPRTFAGTAFELSPLQTVVRLEGSETTTFFDGLGRTTPIGRLLFPASGVERFGRVERLTLDVDSLVSTVRVSFVGDLDLTEALAETGSLDGGSLLIVLRTTSDSPSLSSVARSLYWLSQASDAAAAIEADVAGQLSGGAWRPALVEVRSLRIGSIDLVLGGSAGSLLLLYGAFRGALDLRKRYWDSEKAKQEALSLRWKNERDGIMGKSDPTRLLDIFRSWLSRRDGQAQDGLDEDQARKIASKQLMPAVSEVVEQANGDVDLTLSLPDASMADDDMVELEAGALD